MTNTYTIGKSTSLEYTHTISTIYETITSKGPATEVAVPGPSAPHESVVYSTSSITEVGYSRQTIEVPAGTPNTYVLTKTIVPVPSSAPGNTEIASSIGKGAPGYSVIGANEVPSSVAPGAPGVTKGASSVPGSSPPGATEAASSVYYTVGGNGTAGGPTGSSAGAVPTYESFKGAASKMGTGLMSVVLAAVAAVVLL